MGNTDGEAGQEITAVNNSQSYTYQPMAPYEDKYSNTLADVAMTFWKKDLRPDLANNVPTNRFDNAFWQHMVNFTIGLGVEGTQTNNNLNEIIWPEPNTDQKKIDDLYHAAVNSGGRYFSAADPDTFSQGLSAILSNIADRSATSANSPTVTQRIRTSSTTIYHSQYDTSNWTGRLIAYAVEDNGATGDQLWDASDMIPEADKRIIISHNGSKTHPFRWNNLSDEQKTALNNQRVVNYLRGTYSDGLRKRDHLLGDIIHSTPAFVAAPSQSYPDNIAAKEYSAFKEDNSDRTPMIYVGANDGMLHAFNAENGRELFAYIPYSVYPNLAQLASEDYSHQYYVDGDISTADVYFENNWHTVLVASLRGGGQGIFAIDITNPEDFNSESSAQDKVLWEFTDKNDADLGYTFGQPQIARLATGEWAAIFGSGYNNTVDNHRDDQTSHDSQSGNGVIYIVNIADGSLIKKIDTKEGFTQDPTGEKRPNGITTPTLADYDGDHIADAIYAGDLYGNIWKVDISSSNTLQWQPTKLFQSCSNNNCHQAITSSLNIDRHPTGEGFLIYAGTGKYLESADNQTTGQTTQAMYAIWDKNQTSATTAETISLDDLLQQTITHQFSIPDTSRQGRAVSSHAIDWTAHKGWHFELSFDGNNQGERVMSSSVIINNTLLFNSFIPPENPCSGQGMSWTMLLNKNNGGRAQEIFDVNQDGQFNQQDTVEDGDESVDVSAIGYQDTILFRPTVLYIPDQDRHVIVQPPQPDEASGQQPTSFSSNNLFSRRSWIQLSQ